MASRPGRGRRPGARTRAADRALFDRMSGPPNPGKSLARSIATAGVTQLRAQPGVHVRLPSHQQPPFRAFEWCFQLRLGGVPANTTEESAVTFFGRTSHIASLTEGDRVPEGVLGVISRAECWGYKATNGANPFDTFSTLFWSLGKDGATVQGFDRRTVSGTFGINFTAVAPPAQTNVNTATVNTGLLVPVQLAPGAELRLAFVNEDAASPASFFVHLAGWFYPVTGTGSGIEETITD